jgi:hypothetical protein
MISKTKKFPRRLEGRRPRHARSRGCQAEAGRAEGLSNGLETLNLISDAIMAEKSSKIGHQPTLPLFPLSFNAFS